MDITEAAATLDKHLRQGLNYPANLSVGAGDNQLVVYFDTKLSLKIPDNWENYEVLARPVKGWFSTGS